MVPSINHMPIYSCSEFPNQYQHHDYNMTGGHIKRQHINYIYCV